MKEKILFQEKRSGKNFKKQVIVSNIDIGFIVTSLNKEFNINKIERFVNIVNINNIKPIIILTKSDLCDDFNYYISIVKENFKDMNIIVTSSFNNQE